MTCRHCNRWKVSRPRGLCHRCYYTPGVRDMYQAKGTTGTRETERYDSEGLPTPTDALPGTHEKVLVMKQRAAMSLDLFHPGDLNPV